MEMLKLKGLLVENKKTYKDLAAAIDCSVTSVNSKMNGRTPFDCWEVKKIKDWLHLSDQECIALFIS